MNYLDQFKFDPEKCVICLGDKNEKLVTPRPDGLQTILDSCARRADTRLTEYLCSNPALIYVHNSCRKRYIDMRKLNKESTPEYDNDAPVRKKL